MPRLPEIAPIAWEHPADRAALNALRALPGFDDVVRKVGSFFGERGIRHLFLANAVRVGPRQRPQLDALLSEVLDTMDWAERPQLYVTQKPEVNAYAIGFEHPFIVVTSAALELLDRDERRVVLGHELGHIISGHTTYTTIAQILLLIGWRNLPFLTGLALLPIELALFEWYRKAELSCDRAGLLATQDPMASMRVFFKFAGGLSYGDDVNLDEFLAQAREYETTGTAVDTAFKAINVALRTHPFNTVRAGELQRWIATGDYDRIVRGEYPRRGSAEAPPFTSDLEEAGSYYAEQARQAATQVGEMIGRARDAVSSAFRSRGNTP
ncbi:MAG TPA: M48 family metallopeptidase [Gemmatimonadaceae bacterium]|nr:M48 family metallopeptidase [Gemmatimonadaceae bacterium]